MKKEGIIVLCLSVVAVALVMVWTGVFELKSSSSSSEVSSGEQRKVVTLQKKKLMASNYVLGRARKDLKMGLEEVEKNGEKIQANINEIEDRVEELHTLFNNKNIAPQIKEKAVKEAEQLRKRVSELKTNRVKFLENKPLELKEKYADLEAKVIKDIEDIIREYVVKNGIDEVLEVDDKKEDKQQLEDISQAIYDEYLARLRQRRDIETAKAAEKKKQLSAVVYGAVERPKMVYIEDSSWLIDVIREAGGMTSESNNSVLLTRDGVTRKYDLKKRADRQTLVKAKDKVKVLKKAQYKDDNEEANPQPDIPKVDDLGDQFLMIQGHVKQAGKIKYTTGIKLREVIELAGDRTAFGAPRVRLTRNAKQYLYDLRREEHLKLKLYPNDILEVPTATYMGLRYKHSSEWVKEEIKK